MIDKFLPFILLIFTISFRCKVLIIIKGVQVLTVRYISLFFKHFLCYLLLTVLYLWCIIKIFFIFMKYIDDINLFKSNKDFVAEIDMTGSLGRIYHYPQRMEGCLFLLCLRGECDITIHLSEHKIQKNDIVTILPETFVHVHRQSPDCRLYLIGFNKELLNGINLFNSTMNYLSALIDTPIIPLRPEITELFQDYFMLLIKMKRMGAKPNKDLISTCCSLYCMV